MATLISGSTGVNKITDGTIVNADIASGAAIAGTKLVMPTGSVLQVVQGGTTSIVTTASTTFATLMSQAITITSGNKVLVSITMPMAANSPSTPAAIQVLFSGSSSGTLIADVMVMDEHHASSGGFYSVQSLHAPGSGTSFTYTVQGKRVSGSGSIFWNSPELGGATASRASITLMEIAG